MLPHEYFREIIAKKIESMPRGAQKELANYMDTAASVINDWLKGRRLFGPDRLEKVANFFGSTYLDIILEAGIAERMEAEKMTNEERAWWRNLTDELRAEIKELKKRQGGGQMDQDDASLKKDVG